MKSRSCRAVHDTAPHRAVCCVAPTGGVAWSELPVAVVAYRLGCSMNHNPANNFGSIE